MADQYVYSTLTADNVYNGILIAGGANVSNKHFLTAQGAVTKVTDEELKKLEGNRVFQAHKKNGFIKVDSKKLEIEAVVADMQGADDSAPDTEADADKVEQKTGTKTRAKKDA